MGERAVSWRHTAGFGAGLLGLAVGLAVVAIAVRGRGGLSHAVNVAALVSFVVGIAQLTYSLWSWWHASTEPQVLTSQDIAKGKDVLAGLVGSQWDREAGFWSLDYPDLIPVQWRIPRRAADVMDHPANLSAASLELAGSSDDIAALTDKFRAMRRRRLVVLGGPGTGKTTLAVQLVRQLLATRPGHEDEPVPVLVSVAGWDPGVFPHLQDWLAARLAQDYPVLRSASLGPEMPKALADRGQILPVLDGLDELPQPAQVAVITALNKSLGDSDQLIVTSRTTEFRRAVKKDDPKLASAVVIQAELVKPAVAADYLSRCLQGRGGPAWEEVEEVLDSLRTPPGPRPGPAGTLAKIIDTPLGLWLLRTVYFSPGTDPAALLTDLARFPDAKTLRAHLFDQLVGALIKTRPPSKDPADLFRPRRLYDPEDVARWLGYLARLLTNPPDNSAPTHDLVWSRLHKAVPLDKIRLVVGIGAGLAFGLAVGIRSPLAVKLALVFLGGLVAGLLFGCGEKFDAKPAYANLRLHKRGELLAKKFEVAYKIPLILGILFGFAVAPVVGPATALRAGVAFAIVGTIMFGLADWITTPSESSSDHVSTPPSELRGDLRVTCAHVLGVASTIGVTVGIAFGPAAGSLTGIAFGLTGGLGTVWRIRVPRGPTIPVAFGFGGSGTAGAAYCVTAVLLWVEHRSPRRLMGFLDDAHRLGLLRAVGPTYQFRHAGLQDRLAEAYPGRR